MPWKETCPIDQRVALIADWLRGEWTMTELGTRYQIRRKTAYKWIDRYIGDPETALRERSRAPKVHGRARPDEIRERWLALRRDALRQPRSAGALLPQCLVGCNSALRISDLLAVRRKMAVTSARIAN